MGSERMNGRAKGYLLGAVAAATYGMNPLFALPLYDDGMGTDAVLFWRYLFAIPVLAAMLKARGRGFGVAWRDVPMLAAFGVLCALSSLTLFLSYRYMDAGIASTLLFVYPMLVAVMMAVGFGERLSGLTMGCIVVAMCGIGLLYRGDEGVRLSLTGTVLVFGSALSYAVYIVGINRTRLRDVATLKVTLYVLVFGLLLFAGRLLAEGEGLAVPSRSYLWGNLVALGVFPTAISFLCTTAAIQCIGSTPTAILGVLEPVTALVLGVTVFGEQLTGRDVVGIVLIIVAVVAVVAGGEVGHALVRFRKMFPRLRGRGKMG